MTQRAPAGAEVDRLLRVIAGIVVLVVFLLTHYH